MSKDNKRYLGDSVYVTYDGMFRLTTENGLPDDPSNKIAMEDFVVQAFFRYIEDILKVSITTKTEELPG